jgi:hypothetical protein
MKRNCVNIQLNCHHTISSFYILVLPKCTFTDKYHFCIFLVLFAVRLRTAAHSYPLLSYMILKFLQRGFAERAVFEESIPDVGQGFTASPYRDRNR